MRASVRVSGLLAFSLFLVPSIFAQTNPPPSDPHELVIHQPRTLSNPAERSAAIDLLENARQDLNMHTFGAYQLKASFQTSGASQNEGDGTMEELSNGPEWRWTAQISRCERSSRGRQWARVRSESQRAGSDADSGNSRGFALANLPECRSPKRDSIGERETERQAGHLPAAEFGGAGKSCAARVGGRRVLH